MSSLMINVPQTPSFILQTPRLISELWNCPTNESLVLDFGLFCFFRGLESISDGKLYLSSLIGMEELFISSPRLHPPSTYQSPRISYTKQRPICCPRSVFNLREATGECHERCKRTKDASTDWVWEWVKRIKLPSPLIEVLFHFPNSPVCLLPIPGFSARNVPKTLTWGGRGRGFRSTINFVGHQTNTWNGKLLGKYRPPQPVRGRVDISPTCLPGE